MNIGEIWEVNLADATGHEQAGTRPAIIVAIHNAAGLCTVVPLTLTMRYLTMFPHTFFVPRSSQNGLRSDSVALIFQVRSLANDRFQRKWGDLESSLFATVKIMLRQCLNI